MNKLEGRTLRLRFLVKSGRGQTLISSTRSSHEEGISSSSNRNRESSNGIYRDGKTEDDGVLVDNREAQGKRPNEVGRTYEQLEYDFKENDTRGDSLHIEVEKSTSFVYSKDNPKDLLPKEILENIPEWGYFNLFSIYI